MCLFEDDKDQEIGSALGLRKIMREIIQSSLKGTEITAASSSPSSYSRTSNSHNDVHNGLQKTRVIPATNKQREKRDTTVAEKQQSLPSSLITINYPCSVHNRFECPYRNCPEIDDPVVIGEILEEIYNALSYAHLLTYQTRDYTYKVDFEIYRKVETISRYGGWFSRRSDKRIGVELTNLKQPKVPIESIRDIYNALTNTAILDVLLEEYLKHRRNDLKDYEGIPTFAYAKLKERHDARRRFIIEWFMKIKDDIKNRRSY
jgi:hypothetical protein